MKIQIDIKETDEQICITAPYSATNNKIFRSRGGHFDRNTSAWVFQHSPAVKTMIDELWGHSSESVRVEIDGVDERIEDFDKEWMLKGYVVAIRQARSWSVKTPDSVQLVSGKWAPSGGSVAHPHVTGEDIVLHVIVRKDFAERERLEIVEEESPINPLERFTDKEIMSECVRRGFIARSV